MSQLHLINPTDLQNFVTKILIANGTSSTHADIVSKCLVSADLRGVDTHGSNRIPSYMERIRQKALDASAIPTIEQKTPVAAQVNGHNGFGFVAAHMAMERAIEMAQTFGMGMVSVKHSNHFGMSAWLVKQALEAGMMSLFACATSLGRAGEIDGGFTDCMWGSEWGRNEAVYFGYGAFHRGSREDLQGVEEGEKIPDDWALDKDGNRTDDPAKALEGVMLPMGGPKGSALSIMMDVFSGVFSGAAFAGHVTNPYDPSKPADVGHFIVAIKPDLFMSMEEFQGRMDYLYKRVVESERMAGVERIYFPGELEIITEEKRLVEGIPFAEAEIASLNKEADLVGVEHLKVQTSI
ncbi:Malate/L-lactate dehydrogenase [Penicillium frequentans]|uniref:Malate/L-lactate dehydrogenase n=1 Tax=Penicillium frequentans TaxID=3151616 RepID=A0AAD6GJW2_9EURO|nr:Malate/L-lactate dehydrogenase [Penicillium glabrum]KAJ5560669.1 Malate/L-lactate dehydrogenase [Penicillium glabrum]